MSGFCLLLPGYLTVHGSAHPDPSSSSFSMPSFVLFTGCSLARKLLPHQPFLGWHLSGPPTSIAILSSQKALSSSLGLFLSSRTDSVCFNPVSLFVGVPLLVYICLKIFFSPQDISFQRHGLCLFLFTSVPSAHCGDCCVVGTQVIFVE